MTFTPTAGGRPSSAVTEADGSYELMYTDDALGAVLGKHDVRVDAVSSNQDYESGKSETLDDATEVQTEPLEVEVKAGSNTINIPL